MKSVNLSIGLTVILVFGVLASFVLASGVNIEDMTIVAASQVQPGAQQDVPMGQGPDGDVSLLPEESDALDEDDLFGTRGGYFHPYINLGVSYTDNLYNLSDDKTENFLTSISPGIWLSLPRTKEIPIRIQPHNSSPGGLQYQLKDYEGTDRYQAYALAGLDYKMYSDDSDLNDTDANVEGLFRYNMRGGLSLQVLDRYTYGQDRFEVGSASRNNLRRYYSNIFMGTVDYELTEKLRAKVDYSNFILDYDDEINDFLNRQDNSLALFGYYMFSMKTDLFLQYRYTDVKYDDAEAKDSTQNYIYGGISWQSTEKTSFKFKIGYQKREYSDDVIAEGYDWEGLTFDLQTRYQWTEKTLFTFDLYRKSEESDSGTAVDKVTLGGRFAYSQKYTDKLSGSLSFLYENNDYSEVGATSRDDNRYYVRPALQYLFREWLMTELAYTFDKRESTDDLFDYESNTVLLNLSLAM